MLKTRSTDGLYRIRNRAFGVLDVVRAPSAAAALKRYSATVGYNVTAPPCGEHECVCEAAPVNTPT